VKRENFCCALGGKYCTIRSLILRRALMENSYQKYVAFNKKIIMVGFGSVGQSILPLLFRHIDVKPEQVTILTKKDDGAARAEEYGVNYRIAPLTKENYEGILSELLNEGDFLLNLSVDVSSVDLIKLCQQKNVLYLDTCIEPWEGGYIDNTVVASKRSNYIFREAVLALKKNNEKKATAVVTHGANPGLVSHLVKLALLNIAADTDLKINTPTTREEWAALAHKLQIKVIHIAERDTQIAKNPKQANEFVNTWSIDGFVSEGSQPAELGWGTHERHLPHDASAHDFGSQCAIFLNRPGAATRVRTWTPLAGPFHGFLITHGEAISIADYLTIKEGETLHYRPTVHYAYHPCEDAVLSLHELAGREWDQQKDQRLIFDEVVDGMDELGVLLMGNPRGAYWYGSQLTIHEARKLVPHNNATSLQISSSVMAGMVWAMKNPQSGIVEPDEMDYKEIFDITLPYLGKVSGHYTDWTPLKERERLFPESLDVSDPWQFINIRVS
jgi:homospermidine synthase